ncbi:MAG: hypothetical protein ABI587_16180 [Gemmatimonadales bacterium]
MPTIEQLTASINAPTLIVAVLLVVAVLIVIKVGKALLMAGVFGAMAGGASLGQGNTPGIAGAHAAIGFGIAAVTLFLIKFTKSLMLWLLITALGVGAMLIFGVGR